MKMKHIGINHAETMGNSHAEIMENGHAETMGNSRTELMEKSHTELMENGHAETMGNSRTEIMEKSQTETMETSHTEIMENGHAETMGNSHAEIRENGHAETMGNSRTELMEKSHTELIDKLNERKGLSHAEWVTLISEFTEEDRKHAAALAEKITREHFGDAIYFRGIIEFSNVCRNDCYYCGIRRSNENVERYRLSEEDIMLCCKEGYRLGYRTFVLQSGEDAYWSGDRLIALIHSIRKAYPDCAITLSVGECSRESYEAMFEAGANRYLLRHETADFGHYARLHPEEMSLENRLRCLKDLKEIGFQAGCGMMVGTPFQTAESLALDMELMCDFKPAMAGIGPFIPHKDTPFNGCPTGSQELSLFLLSLTRIMLPDVLLPSTTALGTAAEDGRVQGVLAGCNVVMPNLSPQNVRKNYMLYNDKLGIELSAEESLQILKKQMDEIGKTVVTGRGDHRDFVK